MAIDFKLFYPYRVSGLKRLGNKHDGGYVVHSPSLQDVDYLINYGVGFNVQFEKDFYCATDKPTLAFDPTLKDLKFAFQKLAKNGIYDFLRHLKNYTSWLVTERTLNNYKINFVNEGIANTNSSAYKTFEYHLNKYDLAEKKIIFKMDIEGGEYEIFSSPHIYSLLTNVVQIIIEFHYVDQKIDEVAKILNELKKSHSLVHIHENNHANPFEYQGKIIPGAFEATFLSNAYIPEKRYSDLAYPSEQLDSPCNHLKKDMALDFFYE